MNAAYYPAHRKILPDGTEEIQPVLQHLQNTAQLAAAFSAPFGAEEDAKQAGMVHDLGKYSEDFRKHITHPELSLHVDHSTAGAQVIGRICPVAFAVAGHHGGIPDGGNRITDTGDDTTLAGRLKRRNLPDCSVWRQVLTIPAGRTPDFCNGANRYAWQFYTRMLYSSLVDADYLDTEQFMSPQVQRPKTIKLNILKEKLDAFTQAFYPPKGPLNKMRCDVLTRCNAGEDLNKGLYSLTVPTGGGKTLSSLSFALSHGTARGMDRVIYVVPYTSIIDQTAEIFRSVLGDDAVLEHHSGVLYDDTEANQKLALATENWDMPVIVTTAVQFFESLYANRSSKCRKLHNLANSVIVFDEAQMLPLPFLLPCVYAISELVKNYNATALLCTATQPALNTYFDELGLSITELCPHPETMFAAFRRVHYQNVGKVTVGALADELSRVSQVLCVVNRRKIAAELCRQLPEEGRFCLTTLLYPAHRKKLLHQIRERLKNGLVCRVISTSLIEAGVDVDFPRAFREEAGLDSVIQTAGRCNREGRRPSEDSVVTIFSLEGKPPTLLQQNIQSAERVWKSYKQPDSPEAVSEYFCFLRDLKGKRALDRQGILDAFDRGINGCCFPFAQVAQKMQIIDSAAHIVYIPLDEGAALIQQLRAGVISRQLFRKLGQYAVTIYPRQMDALINAGAVSLLPSSDGILEQTALYDPVFGLQPEAETDSDLFI